MESRCGQQDGYAETVRAYDVRDKMVEEAYFDEAGKPTAFDGYTKITLVYDARGISSRERYFDEAGKPTRSKDGYARLTQVYDERGNVLE